MATAPLHSTASLETMSDESLLRRLADVLRDTRRGEAELVAHIGEVDRRGLYLREACSSMFAYCTERLHLSEPETNLRILVARAARRHPVLLDKLRQGELHLSAIALLAPHLTEENRDEVMRRATHRTKAQVQELVASLAPRADAPTFVRRLRQSNNAAAVTLSHRDATFAADVARASRLDETTASSGAADRCGPAPDVPRLDETLVARPRTAKAVGARPGTAQAAESSLGTADTAAGRPAPRLDEVGREPAKRPAFEPLAPQRYRVQFTASAELKRKLERLQTLMLGSLPHADLAAVIEAAVGAHIERIEAKRLAAVKAPRTTVAETDTRSGPRPIPAAVKRAVRERDGDHCAYVDARGHRCSERRHLQFHHRHPYGMGGDRSPANIALRCRWHNAYEADRDYGRPRGQPRPQPPGPAGSRPAANAAAGSPHAP